MELNIAREVRRLRAMTTAELKEKYVEVFGERPRSHNRTFLWRRIAWRIQALAEGDLSERARRRAEELANDADLRVRAPRGVLEEAAGDDERTVVEEFIPPRDDRLPMAGAVLTREYRGKVVRVMVLEKGFEYQGEVYRSLTGVTRAITGSHWNGYDFFGLRRKGGDS